MSNPKISVFNKSPTTLSYRVEDNNGDNFKVSIEFDNDNNRVNISKSSVYLVEGNEHDCTIESIKIMVNNIEGYIHLYDKIMSYLFDRDTGALKPESFDIPPYRLMVLKEIIQPLILDRCRYFYCIYY